MAIRKKKKVAVKKKTATRKKKKVITKKKTATRKKKKVAAKKKTAIRKKKRIIPKKKTSTNNKKKSVAQKKNKISKKKATIKQTKTTAKQKSPLRKKVTQQILPKLEKSTLTQQGQSSETAERPILRRPSFHYQDLKDTEEKNRSSEDAMENVDDLVSVEDSPYKNEGDSFREMSDTTKEYNPDDEFEDESEGDYNYGWEYNDAFDKPDKASEESDDDDEDELYVKGSKSDNEDNNNSK